MDLFEITAGELRTKLGESEGILLLDVRDAEELTVSSGLSGAIHIPMGDVPGRTHELDPDAEIVVYCTRGQRSASVAKFLRDRDFDTVRSLSGGLMAWDGGMT